MSRRAAFERANPRAIMFHIGVATQAPPLPENHGLSEPCVDFIEKCLTLEPPERPTAPELLKHEWVGDMVAQLASRVTFPWSILTCRTTMIQQDTATLI
jgi:serine/threonine protein kinase